MSATTATSPAQVSTKVARRRRSGRRLAVSLLTAVGMSAGLMTTATPASAAWDAGASATATETVLCDSVAHTVTVTINSTGYAGGEITSTPTESWFAPLPVWVQIHHYADGQWWPTRWVQIPSERSVTINYTGTSFWYFDYAFQTASGDFAYASEWAGGQGSTGWYSDERGYRTLPSCES